MEGLRKGVDEWVIVFEAHETKKHPEPNSGMLS
jgi:hypothetical protein